MFPIVARAGTVRLPVPSPKNSTNLLTTLALRSISVTVSTRSVAVTPPRRLPLRWNPTTSGGRMYGGWRRNPGQVLEQDARQDEGAFLGEGRLRLPVRELTHVAFRDLLAVAIAQHRLEHDAYRHRQARHVDPQGLSESGQGVVLPGLPGF